jgi:FkbM family methyltransferase
MNRDRRIPALVNFCKWQIASRLLPGPMLYDWVNGSKIIIRRGETGLTGNLYCGLHEFADMGYLLHALDPEDLFVDVGANVGSYTILACAAVGARGYCFEPVPSTYRRLMDNLRINDLLGRVEALNIGLSDKPGELAFTADENAANHVLAVNETSSDSVRVKVLPLDAILGEDEPSIMKIDVEGFETLVLGGAHTTLSRTTLHSVIMELNGSGARYGFADKKLLELMSGYGFSTYRYEPFSRTLSSLEGRNASSGNTLFLRGEPAIRARLAAAPRVKVGPVWL